MAAASLDSGSLYWIVSSKHSEYENVGSNFYLFLTFFKYVLTCIDNFSFNLSKESKMSSKQSVYWLLQVISKHFVTWTQTIFCRPTFSAKFHRYNFLFCFNTKIKLLCGNRGWSKIILVCMELFSYLSLLFVYFFNYSFRCIHVSQHFKKKNRKSKMSAVPIHGTISTWYYAIMPRCFLKENISDPTTILDGRGSPPSPPSYHTRSSKLRERDITDSKFIKKKNSCIFH